MCVGMAQPHMALHSTVLEGCSASNASAQGCLLTLQWLCCLQFKNPPDYSKMHLSPAQFEQYNLHADADRTAKMHSAVSHGLRVSNSTAALLCQVS